MHATTLPSRLHIVRGNLRLSYAIVLTLAANFIWATGHDEQRCIELVALGVALALALVSGALPRAVGALSAPVRGVCMAFLLLGAAASVGVVSPRHAWAEWSMFVLLGLTVALVAAEIAMTGTAGLLRLLQLLGVVCLLYSLRVLLVYGAALAATTKPDYHMLAIGFSNARFLNHAQTPLLPMLVLLARPAMRTRIPAKLFFLVAAFWWALIYVSEARATALALLVGVIVVVVLQRHAAKGWLLTLLATAAAGLLIYLVLFIALPWALGMGALGAPSNLLARTAADPVSGRQFLWHRALELIAGHPLLGVGPQQFAHFGSDLQTGAHPHDWVFQIATEWGIPAFLCVAALLAYGVRGLVRAARRLPAAAAPAIDIASAFIVAVTAIVVDGLFSGVLVMPQSQLVIALVLGMAAGWVRALQTVSSPMAGRTTRYAGMVLAVVALAIAALTMGPDIARKWHGLPLDAVEQARNMGTHWPRLWEAGFF